MERNVTLYTVYQGFWNMLFWTPVFFLYFSSVLSPERVLQLEAIYYLAVVLLEVPSGYFSDLIGRRRTLLGATLCWIAACTLFALGGGFGWFVAAQVLLAMGMAFNSGTDTSLLYESLEATGRGSEVAEVEARAQAAGFRAAALAALAGGIVAGVNLRLAYLFSAFAALGAFVVAWWFTEPPRRERAMAPLRQLVACGKALRQPVLSWVFCFAVAMTVFNHVPYEFYQPYLELLLTGAGGGYDVTPMVAGLLVAAVSMAGAWASGRSPAVRDRLGVPATLLAMMVLHGTVILAMSAWLNPMVLLLILLRSVPRAIAAPVIRAAIHPRISQEVRATFLSLLSLAGRLGFSLSLYAASRMIGAPERLDFSLIGQVLQAYAIGLGGVLAGLLLFSFLVNWSDGEWGSTGTEA